jgi:tetratricopeptide (TPR) repeat protein
VGILSLFGRDLWQKAVPSKAVAESARLDPRLSYEGPYRNIHPDVQYVGDASCLTCHPNETASFHQHPMGRSLLPIAQVAPEQVYDKAHNNPFQALGSQFIVERQSDKVQHRQKRQDAMGNVLVDYSMEVHYAIGSGRAGYSYLTDRDGYLFQTAISWFSQKQIWDLSPGFNEGLAVGRPIEADCLFCHANQVRPRQGYKNRFEQPIFDGTVIGCERCHGPGQRHIETVDKLDIVNPKNLSAALYDAVCEQCHLSGIRVLPYGREQFDFRPGLPREDFFSVFVYSAKPGEKAPAVTHVEEMHESRCYQGTSGDAKLKCASCHSPHHYVGTAQRVAHYRASCLACHENQGCSLPRAVRLQTSKEDSCIDCHMSRQSTEDIPHTAATDHRILRSVRSKPTRQMPWTDNSGGWLLTPFGGRRVELGDRQAERDLGIALIQASSGSLVPASRGAVQAQFLLDRAQVAPDDSDAWEAEGYALLLQHNGAGARAAFDQSLSVRPERERALAGAAEAAGQEGQVEKAIDYWRRAVKVNPWMPIYRRQLALLLMRKQLWDEVRSTCQAWMRLDPGSTEARMLWVTCLASAGEKDKAREEFTHIEALQPPNLDQLRALFAQQMR